MITKHWQIAEPIPPEVGAEFAELDPVLLQLLWNRGLRTPEQIDEFLNPDWSQDVHDPYLFRDMAKAVARVYEAIGAGEVMGVFGDYDADGVTASVIIATSLKKLGAKVEVYLPHREREGYGLNEEAIRYLKEKGVSLVLTCDCGITNVKQVAYANELGLNVIITDHHQTQPELPLAFAIIHPGLPGETYPFKFLSGGGVAFKLVQGLLRYEGCQLAPPEREAHQKWLLDLVAISTVADMVPLQGESRTLVKYGLTVLRKTRRLGLRKLIEVASLRAENIDTYTIGFQLAPRINAAGRMDHANAAYALLMSEEETQAAEMAQALQLANGERQRVTEEMYQTARAQIGEVSAQTYLVQVFNPTWSLGLVGLVAGKLVQEYNRPALVMCQVGDKVAGSGRSGVADFDLSQALTSCRTYLSSWGGHKEAAGFSLPKANLENFISAFTLITAQALAQVDLTPKLQVDLAITLGQVDWGLQQQVARLEPVGQANPPARLVSYHLTVAALQPVGSQGQHLRLTLVNDDDERRFIWFRQTAYGPPPIVGEQVDVVYEVGVNEWNGNRELELKVVDLIKSNSKSPAKNGVNKSGG